MKFRPTAYEVCDWCNARRDMADFSEVDDHERYEAGWSRSPEGADLCGTCTRARADAIANIKAQRTLQSKKGAM